MQVEEEVEVMLTLQQELQEVQVEVEQGEIEDLQMVQQEQLIQVQVEVEELPMVVQLEELVVPADRESLY
jgi:hypothetical protein